MWDRFRLFWILQRRVPNPCPDCGNDAEEEANEYDLPNDKQCPSYVFVDTDHQQKDTAGQEQSASGNGANPKYLACA
jgi:hypothetical protein